MEYRTTKFNVSATGLNYHLGLRSSVDIDYWAEKANQWIEWKAVLVHNQQGITNLYGYAIGAFFWLGYRIDLDDLSPKEEEHLLKEWDGEIYNGYIEGQFAVSTYTEKDWQIEFSVAPKPSIVPSELVVNFMDKLMEVI